MVTTQLKDLKYGDITLEDVLSGPNEPNQEKLELIDKEIERLGGSTGRNAISIEKEALRKLVNYRKSYHYLVIFN